MYTPRLHKSILNISYLAALLDDYVLFSMIERKKNKSNGFHQTEADFCHIPLNLEVRRSGQGWLPTMPSGCSRLPASNHALLSGRFSGHGPKMAAYLKLLCLFPRQENRSGQIKCTRPWKRWEPRQLPFKGLLQKSYSAPFAHTVWTRLCHMGDEIISQGYFHIEQNQSHISNEDEKIDVGEVGRKV